MSNVQGAKLEEEIGEMDRQLVSMGLWIEHWLKRLEYRSTAGYGPNQASGFSFAPIPDWDLRQKLDEIHKLTRKR